MISAQKIKLYLKFQAALLHPLCPTPLPRGRWKEQSWGTSVWSLKFVRFHCFFDPLLKPRDSGVDIWRCICSIGHNALGHTVTHERAPGVTLWAERARAELSFFRSGLPATLGRVVSDRGPG